MKKQNLELKKMELSELSNNELEQTNGGLFWIPIMIGVGIGYLATRGGKSSHPAPSASCTITIHK
jgi:lactobin A/cerein 7B family class IIb bacteriocin